MKNEKQIKEAIEHYTLKLSFELADYASKHDDEGFAITTGELIACANILEYMGVPKKENKPSMVLEVIKNT